MEKNNIPNSMPKPVAEILQERYAVKKMDAAHAEQEKLKKEAMAKINVIGGDEFRNSFIAVADVAADILANTLGPYASTTAIDNGTGFTFPTKDGWHVISNLLISEPTMNMMLKLIKDISFSLNSKVGDGTTTAIVTAQNFIKRYVDFVNADVPTLRHVRQADLIRYMNEAKEAIIAELKDPKRVHHVKRTENGYDDIFQIAKVAANGDEHIAGIIKEIYDKTDNPNIFVTSLGGGDKTSYEIQQGYKLDSKLLLSDCYINTDDRTCRVTNPMYVIVFNHNVTYTDHARIVQVALNHAHEQGRKIAFFAPYFDEPFMNVFATQLRKCINSGLEAPAMFVQVGMTTSTLKNYADDFACLCGTQMFDYGKVMMCKALDDQAEGVENSAYNEYSELAKNSSFHTSHDVIVSCMGIANTCTFDKKFTLLENFPTDTVSYQTRFNIVTEEFNEVKQRYSKTLDFINNEYMNAHMRYVKFLGSTGIIKVGGEHDLVKQCNKDTIDDAVLACRSAFEYGFIRGLNIETIDATRIVSDMFLHLDYEGRDDTKDQDEEMIRRFTTEYPDENTVKAYCATMIAIAFEDTTKRVMANKKPGGADHEGWKSTKYANADGLTADWLIINACCEDNMCYDLVTEEFVPAGTRIINSVATDVEIINAVTSMLTLILSSNQLLSTNRPIDKQAAKDIAMENAAMEAEAITSGVMKVIDEAPPLFKIAAKVMTKDAKKKNKKDKHLPASTVIDDKSEKK